MRELTGDTKIRVAQYPDFEEFILSEPGLIEDAQTYNIGDISKKTGLQKCLVNGRIVWLLPHQSSGFSQTKMAPGDLKTLAKSTKKAKPDSQLQTPTVKGAKKYMKYMMGSWKTNPVTSPFFNNAKIRLDGMSYKHLFETHGKPRPPADIVRRAKCLPYVRDILQRTGKPAEHLVGKKNESYSIVGKANIDGTDRGIKVIVSKHTDGKYFYLSVMDLKII